MAKNTGKPSEELFDDFWRRKGKAAFVYKFPDSSSLTGLNGKKVQALAQPCDRLVVHRGQTEFAEVKSTQDLTAFRFSLLRKKQSAFAAFVLAAGAPYNVYVHAMLTDRWYRIPYSWINMIKANGKESIPWVDLDASYRWRDYSV